MKTVLIFGGSGFVGKHIISKIAKNGYKIIVPHQNYINEAKLRLLGSTGQIIPIRFQSINEPKIINLINISDVVLNLKTLWDEKKTTFEHGILDFNIEIVNIIKNNKKNSQFIYFSGIGVNKDSGSLRSKAIYQSEQYIQKYLKNSVLIRPGIIIGGGDQFLKGLLPLFKNSFFIPLFGDGLSKFQPVFIDDILTATCKIIEKPILGKHTFEFTGPEVFTYKELYNYLSDCMNKTRVLVPLPFFIIKFGISVLEKILTPPLNSEQLRLFEKDNIASNNYKNLSDLEIKSQDLREIIKKIIVKNM